MLLALPLLRLLAAVPGVPAELARPLLVYLLALGATWTLARSARLRPLVA
jgi:hypothetical protein